MGQGLKNKNNFFKKVTFSGFCLKVTFRKLQKKNLVTHQLCNNYITMVVPFRIE